MAKVTKLVRRQLATLDEAQGALAVKLWQSWEDATGR